MTGLYVHIPFCRKKCFYCDFFSIESLAQTDRYLEALSAELKNFQNEKIETVYIGGGTPSVLEIKQLDNLINLIKTQFDISVLKEWTIEANPESLCKEKLNLFHTLCIDRLSLGLQSCDDKLLKALGRIHNFDSFCRAFFLAREIGFENISIDLIYGIPNQSLDDWTKDLNKILEFLPDHISLYPLSVEEGTLFYKNSIKTDDNLQRLMYERAREILLQNGYIHYEISNWSRQAKESMHNSNYWRNLEYIGAGAAAAGYLKGVRYKNCGDIEKYITEIKNTKSAVVEKEKIDAEIYNGEKIILGLRLLKEGVGIENFKGEKEKILRKFLDMKVLVNENGSIKIERDFVFVANSIAAEFV
ncbi:MAG: radical SAM family heme chaperone HemW [Elusimicrobiota bacterium]|jgi:oxygen-independent coproporphyrinogen-3 oxidase|nr:radical SAM family heme chaperone HemW [Elusimicrobiota bacterium]